MGFTAIATAAAALPKVMQAGAQYAQSKQLKQAAAEQERVAERQAAAMTDTALANQRRGERNAAAALGRARVDAAVSNLADEGSVRVRETDMATRLQDEISNTANATLQQANATREQGLYNAWNTRNAAKSARYQAFGSLAEGVGAAVGTAASRSAGSKQRKSLF